MFRLAANTLDHPQDGDIIQRGHDVHARHAIGLPHLFRHLRIDHCALAMLTLPPNLL